MIGPRPEVFAKLGMTEYGFFSLLITLLNQAGCMPMMQYTAAPTAADFEKSKKEWARIIEAAFVSFRELAPNLQGLKTERAEAMSALAQVINSVDLGAVEFIDFAEPITEDSFRERINALVEFLFKGPKQVMRTERGAE